MPKICQKIFWGTERGSFKFKNSKKSENGTIYLIVIVIIVKK